MLHKIESELRILARQILGRKGTFLLRRIVSSIYESFHLIPPADSVGRENCISAMILTYNDSDWLEPSILSIRNLVDEYVVIDSSTDETPKILNNLKKVYGLNMRIYWIPAGDLVLARNIGLNKTRCKWILIWDADFIAKTELIGTIRNLLDQLDTKRYYLIYWPMILVCGDLLHTCHNPYHIEHWLYTWSPEAKYSLVGIHDTLIAPLKYYKPLLIRKPLGFHITLRNPARIAIRYLTKSKSWTKILLEKGFSIEEIARKKALELYGTDDLNYVGKVIMKKNVKNLPKLNKELYGDYPEVFKAYVKEKYGIIL